ncbi:FAD-binding oxidoreductase [Nocardioides sp. zg-1228]|uniref:FAD-binding oxidoreductase n=1 Tax=Nocardioides sp. zg-1228 TaxID=2763008 RepID=UPI0016429DBA|nr:FAD-binding oxidoreductase [Nocardioides sp. zg-1228]MBC2934187.1 FAD-binding oxidoreductase [Nocardioides sp. zg-1228]QSF58932.1 FAD-binding oxidoreductase [Nocardioides sp. zg-1228]
MRTPVGWAEHAAGTARLVASYAAVPPGAPVRLAKRTSNLFRGRSDAGPGLDVSGLTGVIEVDGDVAEVQGMCTYEHLVEVTLAHGRIPLVVPQLRTITLGGAVTGLGIEATSFRSGLPHESVLEMDVLTGAGEIVTTKPGDELFDAFPNSYGSLGYATRLRIELEPVPSYVALRHVRFDGPAALADGVGQVVRDRAWQGERVDALDGVAFAPDELYLTLARWTDAPGPTSDYTGRQVFYRSLQQRSTDRLTVHDYLWRWDTDWFWCSRAFGAQHPVVRRVWPRRLRRSDVYWKLVALDRRLGVADRLDRRAGRPQGERVVQDVEVPVERLAEFLDWFDREVGMRPVWLCPLRLRRSGEADGERPWPGYPLSAGTTYVNVGFWGIVNVGPEAPSSPRNRAIEAKVSELGGHKSLYSEAFYPPDEFDRLYGGAQLARVKAVHDPDDRLTCLYDKVVRRR